jgi:hypothetical protein
VTAARTRKGTVQSGVRLCAYLRLFVSFDHPEVGQNCVEEGVY